MVNKSRLLRPTGIFFFPLFFFFSFFPLFFFSLCCSLVVLRFRQTRPTPKTPKSTDSLPRHNPEDFLQYVCLCQRRHLDYRLQNWNTVSLHFIHIIWQIFLLKTILTYKNSAKVHLGSDNVPTKCLRSCVISLCIPAQFSVNLPTCIVNGGISNTFHTSDRSDFGSNLTLLLNINWTKRFLIDCGTAAV